jgi:hypothetical protein
MKGYARRNFSTTRGQAGAKRHLHEGGFGPCLNDPVDCEKLFRHEDKELQEQIDYDTVHFLPGSEAKTLEAVKQYKKAAQNPN